MTITGAAKTDGGRRRPYNEDACAMDVEAGLFVLADGMGGHAAGEVASRLAVEVVTEFIARTAHSSPEQIEWPFGYDASRSVAENRLLSAFSLANQRIFREIETDARLRGMGTTLVAALATGPSVCVAHVGDSRAYLCRGRRLDQVTTDHSWVNEQLMQGLLSRDEAARHPLRNIITRALGSREIIDPELVAITVEPEDRLLLCSDGLTTMLDDREILSTLDAHASDPHAAVTALVEKANDAGGEDNITVIVARFDD